MNDLLNDTTFRFPHDVIMFTLFYLGSLRLISKAVTGLTEAVLNPLGH